MRKFSINYTVNYDVFDKDGKKQVSAKGGTACFGSLFRHDIKEDDVLVLYNFLTKENEPYAKKFIQRLCYIFNCKCKFINENEVQITNIKSKFLAKAFVTIFRILF